MKASTACRLIAAVAGLLVFGAYLSDRDTIRVEGNLSPTELETIVSNVEEWSAPKLFRTIEVRRAPDGCRTAWVREPGNRWSVTVFTNRLGTWQKFHWYLLEEGRRVDWN
jgi:hypothetical protein